MSTLMKNDKAIAGLVENSWTSEDLLIQYLEKDSKSIDLNNYPNVKEFTVLFAGSIARVVIKIPNYAIRSSTCYYYGGTGGSDSVYAVCKNTNGVLTFTEFSKQGVSDTTSSMRVLF